MARGRLVLIPFFFFGVVCRAQLTDDIVIEVPSTPRFVPQHTRGDAEYAGHGPRIEASIQLELRNLDRELWANLRVKAEETKWDKTTAEGSYEFRLYTHATRITRIRSPRTVAIDFTDSNHDVDTINGTGPVRKWVLVGDTKGDDAGRPTGTSVAVFFNPIELTVIRRPLQPTTEQTIALAPTEKIIPTHVGGDREFKGHGPLFDGWAQLEIRNEKELWLRIYMNSRETQKDYTLAEGLFERKVYTHPTEITKILTDQISYFEYRDSNHSNDVFSLGASELVQKFECSGDRKGKDAGEWTGVAITFNTPRIEAKVD